MSVNKVHKIIIGIDFGTTYSGAAWADTTTSREIIPIRQWPNATGKHDVDKVPTEVMYNPEGFKWGFGASSDNVRKSGKVLRYMKLLLDPTQETSSGVPLADPLGLSQMKAALPPNKTPVDVVADYLTAVKAHILDVLSKNYGSDFWEIIPVWSEAAKALTLKAASRAGLGSMNDLILIAEPEAAALYCLTEMYPGLLQVGDTFIVADCGGGTVDLVSYEVLQRNPNLQVKEVAVGGALCGSVFLNRRFESMVRARLGPDVLDEMIRKGRPYHKMMKDFDERLKRTFCDANEQDIMDCEVPTVPDSELTRVEDGFLEITRAEMKEIFEPVIQRVIRLIFEQIDAVNELNVKAVSRVFLIGGFGTSPYLFKRIDNELKQFNKVHETNITLMQPANAWSAVSRGAVICGLQKVQVKTRKARRNYGVEFVDNFCPGDRLKYRYWDKYDAKYQCRNHSYVNIVHSLTFKPSAQLGKGDEISETQEIAFPFVRTVKLDHNLQFMDELYASDSVRDQAERYSTDKNVYQVCSITVNLERLRSKLPKRTLVLTGEQYYEIYYDLVVRIHSSQMTFSFRYEGVTYGDVTTVSFA